MFKLFVIVALFGVAFCAPASDVQIVAQESNVEADGKYHYSFETSDGTKAEQDGEIKGQGEEVGPSVHGTYTYHGDDGKTFQVEYTADENGYQPHGEHIHEVPEAIKRALEYIEAHPYVEDAKKH